MNELNNIPEDSDNLEKHAPQLFKIEKRNCFSVPDNYFGNLPSFIEQERHLATMKANNFIVPEHYFEELPDIIQGRIRSEAEMGDVPADYFDTLADRIQSKIKKTEAKEVKVIAFKDYVFSKYTAVAIAATIALLLGWNTLMKNKDIVKEPATLAMTETEKTAFTQSQEVYTLDESALIDELAGYENTGNGQETVSEVDQADIADYLLENNVDVSSMIKEL